MDAVNDKYIVFKRDDFHDWMMTHGIHDTRVMGAAEMLALPDAVVIRRQDLFASPCLATYASMISLVAKNHSDPDVAKELLAIADYFEDQAKLAADEGWKLPDR